MADLVFNIAKGHVNEYVQRIINNDPTNSALILVLAFGAATDATVEDYDDLAALLGDAGITEATFTNYARITVTNPTTTVSDISDNKASDMPDQTWSSAGGATNNTLTRLFICYDADTGAGTDANIIPLISLDFAVTTDGTDLTVQFNNAGFFQAS